MIEFEIVIFRHSRRGVEGIKKW